MEERSPFPGWLRRMDPTLVQAEASAVYHAFRLRRTEHSRGSIVRRLRGSLGGAGFGSVGFIVAISVAAILILGCLAIPLIAVGGIFLSTAFQRKRRTAHVMPNRLGAVFAQHGFLQDAAVDVWMTGATGRDVLLAIYAEKREGRGLLGAFVLAVIFAIFASAYYAAGEQYHWAGILLGAFALWLCIEIWLTGMVTHGGEVRTRFLEPQVFVWERDGASAAGELAALRLVRSFKGLFVAALVVTPIVVVVVVVSRILFRANASELALSPGVIVALMVSVIVAGFAAACRLLRPRLVAKVARENAELLLRADEAFDRFMAGTVVEDPDGAAWARWRHRQAKAQPLQPPSLPPAPTQ